MFIILRKDALLYENMLSSHIDSKYNNYLNNKYAYII